MRVVRDAVDWVRTLPEVRPARVGLFGASLGAYVAVGAAATDPRISQVVLLGGGLEPGVADSVRHFPPTLLLHGVDDAEVPLAAEDSLVRLLIRHRALVVTHRYPGEGHYLADTAAVDAALRAARFLTQGRAAMLRDVLWQSAAMRVSDDTARTRIP